MKWYGARAVTAIHCSILGDVTNTHTLWQISEQSYNGAWGVKFYTQSYM